MNFARRLDKILPSKTLSITNRVLEMRKAGEDIISLGAGEPDFATPEHVKHAAIDAINKGFTKYTVSTGIPELKEAIATKLKKNNNIDVNPSQVIVSCGGKFALAAAVLALCEEGDEVLIPSPYWVSYPEMVRLAGAKPVFVPTKAEQCFAFDFDELQRALTPKTKLLMFNNPVNPSGAVYDEKVTDNLAEWLKSTNILALTDEIYESIIFDDIAIRSLASYPEIKEQVITVNGVSKTYAMTGWRIGYAAGPKKIIAQMAKIQSHTTSNPTSISQWAAVSAISGDQSFVTEMKAAFKKRRDFVYDRLNKMSGLTCTNGLGAFYLLPDASYFLNQRTGKGKMKDVVELCQYLLEEYRVAVVPGNAFGVPNHFRISFAASMEQLSEAMDRIQAGLHNLDS